LVLNRCARAGLHGRDDERHRAGVGGVLTSLAAGACADARVLVRELVAEEPTWRWADGGRQARPNPRRLELDRLALQVEAWCDRPDRAQRELAAFVAAAPGSALLRRDLAGVYRWRGWPRRALGEARRAQALAGDAAQDGPGTGDALAFESLLDLRRWDDAERELDRIALHDPVAAGALAAAWDERQRFELELRAIYGEGSDQPEFGTRDFAAEGYLFTPPIDDRWRIFGHLYGAWARYEEGDAGLLRTGLGVEYAAGEVVARAELAHDRQRELAGPDEYESERDYEALGSIAWQPNDAWTFDARYESDTLEDPLRARLAGVDAELFGVGAAVRPNELSAADLSLAHLRMQDGNERWYGILGAERRVVTTPRYRLRLRPELYGSTNSEGDETVYYNPESDADLSLTAINEWDGSRRNRRSWIHRVSVTVGNYWQEGFGDDVRFAARYEQELALGARSRVTFGIGWTTRAYDGEREERLWIYVDPLSSRFGGWGR
jgi:biofilm PGA synthesis protein PgaA